MPVLPQQSQLTQFGSELIRRLKVDGREAQLIRSDDVCG